jgi:hypothetical protein
VFPTVQRFLSTPQLIIPKTRLHLAGLRLAGLKILNRGVELGPGLKILLCNREVELGRVLKIFLSNRFNTGLKLFMGKNEGFFYFWESMHAEELIAFQPQGCAPEPEAPECQHILPEPELENSGRQNYFIFQ